LVCYELYSKLIYYFQIYFIRVLAYPDNKAQSDDSSSNSKDVGVSSIYHSDSDDISGAPQPIRFALLSKHLMHLESDSVNENFTPGRPFTRRKRKFKKMIVDPDVKFPSQMTSSCSQSSSSEKRRTTRHSASMPRNCGSLILAIGKRKRSNREIIAGHQGTSKSNQWILMLQVAQVVLVPQKVKLEFILMMKEEKEMMNRVIGLVMHVELVE
jgi:hypothetical protein